MDVLRSARKSRIERIKNKQIKELMGVKGKPEIIDIIEKKRLQWNGHVKRMPEEIFFLLWGCDPTRVMAFSFLSFSRSHTTTQHSR